jgi:hypothetical protein
VFCAKRCVLSIGARLLGARAVIGFDVDPDAIEVAKRNLEEFGFNTEEDRDGYCDLVLTDVVQTFTPLFNKCEKGHQATINSQFSGVFDTIVRTRSQYPSLSSSVLNPNSSKFLLATSIASGSTSNPMTALAPRRRAPMERTHRLAQNTIGD